MLGMKKRRLASLCGYVAVAGLLAVSSGCGGITRHTVIASTYTNLGLEMSQHPVNQSPRLNFGYQRAELALVPERGGMIADALRKNMELGNCQTEEGAKKFCPKEGFDYLKAISEDGTTDTAEVLMELRFSGSTSSKGTDKSQGVGGGLYQRLAVGRTAVKQPGAAFMMARDGGGNIDAATATAMQKTLVLGKNLEGENLQIAVTTVQRYYNAVKKLADDGDAVAKKKIEALDALELVREVPDSITTRGYHLGILSEEDVERLKNVSGFSKLISYRQKLDDYAQVLQAASGNVDLKVRSTKDAQPAPADAVYRKGLIEVHKEVLGKLTKLDEKIRKNTEIIELVKLYNKILVGE